MHREHIHFSCVFPRGTTLPLALYYIISVGFSHSYMELNGLPAAPVAHLEAGQRPGFLARTEEVISVSALHMAPCFRSMGAQFMLRTSCLQMI